MQKTCLQCGSIQNCPRKTQKSLQAPTVRDCLILHHMSLMRRRGGCCLKQLNKLQNVNKRTYYIYEKLIYQLFSLLSLHTEPVLELLILNSQSAPDIYIYIYCIYIRGVTVLGKKIKSNHTVLHKRFGMH